MEDSYLDTIAEAIKQKSNIFAEEENSKGSMYMVPKPPKPGELLYCQICGEPMLPKDFSENLEQKKYEFKWHVHWNCKEAEFEKAERGIIGFARERRDTLKRIRENGRPIKSNNSDPRCN